MNNDIAQLIQHYQGKSFKDLLASPDLERDIAFIGQSIQEQDLNAPEAKAFLQNMMKDIEQAIQDTKAEMATEKDNIDRVKKMSQACVAYLKSK